MQLHGRRIFVQAVTWTKVQAITRIYQTGGSPYKIESQSPHNLTKDTMRAASQACPPLCMEIAKISESLSLYGKFNRFCNFPK